jgi:hypothetical protein
VVECDPCKDLIGKEPSIGGHAGLKAFTSRKEARGWHEMYMCQTCGSRLQRIATEAGARSAGEPWSKV